MIYNSLMGGRRVVIIGLAVVIVVIGSYVAYVSFLTPSVEEKASLTKHPEENQTEPIIPAYPTVGEAPLTVNFAYAPAPYWLTLTNRFILHFGDASEGVIQTTDGLEIMYATHTYTRPGTYWATVTYDCGKDGCGSIPVASITVKPPLEEDPWVEYTDTTYGVSFLHPSLWTCFSKERKYVNTTITTTKSIDSFTVTCTDKERIVFSLVPYDPNFTSYQDYLSIENESPINTFNSTGTKKIIRNTHSGDRYVLYEYLLHGVSFRSRASFVGTWGAETYFNSQDDAEQVGDRIIQSLREIPISQ